jgi:hypothetical protein
MTKQEQVKEILEVIKHCGDYTNRDCAECDYRLYGECKNQKQCEAEALYNEGYRKVPFGATVLAPEERNDEIREMHEILEGRDELIAKVGILGRENYDLKAENRQLKTECALLDDELRIARQDTIDVLNKLKEKIFHCLGIENIQQASGLSLLGSLVPYDIVIDNIDELIKEYV